MRIMAMEPAEKLAFLMPSMSPSFLPAFLSVSGRGKKLQYRYLSDRSFYRLSAPYRRHLKAMVHGSSSYRD